MNQCEEPESGYIEASEADFYADSTMWDVEVLRVTDTSVIARGRRYGRQWFLKGLRPEFGDSVAMKRQLLKEFELHSRLRHPSVVRAVALEEVEGIGLCIIQEWVEGSTLGETLRKGKLTSAELRRIMRELTAAVAYLHSCGVVHRDLKPANVMIRDVGREVVLVDFGLADSSDYVELKQPAGTPGFISPEQMSDGGANPADDVYSLGVIMREACPRYGMISRRCTGRAARRPADAGSLLLAMRRRDRLPRIIWSVLIAAALVAVVLFTVRRIISLENSARDSGALVSELSEKNARNAALVSTLQDSLSGVHLRLDDAENELAEVKGYERLRQDALSRGYRRIDAALRKADREVFSKFTSADHFGYTDALIKLTGSLSETVEAYHSSLSGTGLSSEDAEKIKGDLYNYQAVKLSEYQNRWLKRINPSM